MPCLNPVKVGRDTYPCGKCYECIKQKQMDYAQLMYFQAFKKHSAHFVTLTYDDDYLPIKFGLIEKDSDEMKVDFIYNYKKLQPLREFYFQLCDQSQKDFHRRLLGHQLYILDDGTEIRLCQSLNRRDFRLWLKRCRVYYEREFGKKLSDFSYFAVGEYGEKTYRAHYHCCFFGLTKEEVFYLCHSWPYGFALPKELPLYSSVDVARCVMYVAKYMNKGCANCPELDLENSLMEKPRILCSSGMAVRDGLRSLLTLGGQLSLYSKFYFVDDIKKVIDNMAFEIAGQHYIIGKHFYRYALSVPNETYHDKIVGSYQRDDYQTSFEVIGTGVKDNREIIQIVEKRHDVSSSRFKASPLQIAISFVLRDMGVQRDLESKRESFELFESEPLYRETFGDFPSFLEHLRKSKEQTLRERYKKTAKKSVF